MKKRITIRLDEDVLDWFKGKDGSYQSLINSALRNYIDSMTSKKDVPDTHIKMPPVTEYKVKISTLGDKEDLFFKPMPKTAKGKKPRCQP